MSYNSLFRLQLFLISLQGYLNFFNISIFHSRVMTWSPFLILLIILSTRIAARRSYNSNLLKSIIPLWLIAILLWTILGYLNNNYSTNQDLKSILISISTIYVTYSITSDVNATRQAIRLFCISLIPLILFDIIVHLPGQPQSHYELGRFRLVSVYVYIYFITEVIYHKNVSNVNKLGLIVSLLNTTIFPLSKSGISMIVIGSIIVTLLSRRHTHYTQSKVRRYFGTIVMMSILFVIISTSLSNNKAYYRRYIIDRGLRAWQYRDQDISDVYNYTMEQDNVANVLTSGRVKIWEKTFEDIKIKPLFGYGLGYYQQDYGEYSHLSVHNLYLYLFVCFGIVGMLFLSIGFYQIFKIIRDSLLIRNNYDVKIVCLTMIIVTLFHGLFAILFSFHAILIIFSISIGLSVKMSQIERVLGEFKD
jgi:O-antigen ligase